uniref:Uncharacterized protein n=1 Tax=Arundo donax TaxID=35708 RepID=A0A0A9CE32_ARUDO
MNTNAALFRDIFSLPIGAARHVLPSKLVWSGINLGVLCIALKSYLTSSYLLSATSLSKCSKKVSMSYLTLMYPFSSLFMLSLLWVLTISTDNVFRPYTKAHCSLLSNNLSSHLFCCSL